MIKYIVCIMAGLLAGLGTGFAGLSAAVFISPMLMFFLGLDSFPAVGIALASDVLASAGSAITYARNKNIDLKRGKWLMFSVILSAIAGTVCQHFLTATSVGESFMQVWLLLGMLFLGVSLLLSKKSEPVKLNLKLDYRILSVLCGIYVGFICGFQGTGGGLWMLFVLTAVLGFEFKKAVGTSVTIMTFTALIGAVSHFAIKDAPDLETLIICVVSTYLFAKAGALIANRVSPLILKKITGGMVLLSAAAMIIFAIL